QFSDLWRGWRKKTEEQDDSKRFVKWRLSDKGKEKAEIGITVHAHHKYPHKLGRRTYAGLKEKM
ncbi:hypothetical protein MKW94_001730, partial [Papaver nudicaule]|nr:hypothetical protein [Papaver nudicaule]